MLSLKENDVKRISSRLQRLREESHERVKGYPKGLFDYNYNKSAMTIYKDLPQWEKAARASAYAIVNEPVRIYPDDGIIGRCSIFGNQEPPEELCPDLDFWNEGIKRRREKYPEYDELVANQLCHDGTRSHVNWAYERILERGVTGIMDEVRARLDAGCDEKAREFYNGVLISYEAMLEWNDKYVSELERMGMDELAALCRKVPRYPAENFREALQSYYMQHIVILMESPGNGNGRLDQFLWPYLKKDLDSGLITMEEARDLIGEMFLRLDERWIMKEYDLDIYLEVLTVGGSNKDGTSAVNPLSHMMIELAMGLGTHHPEIYVRIPENPPEDFLELCALYLTKGNNKAQFYSDPAVFKALMNRGIPYEEATTYAISGCMEISIPGTTSDFLLIAWQNAAKMLELMVTGGICLRTGKRVNAFKATKSLAGYDDFESFYKDFIAEAARLTNIFIDCSEISSDVAESHRPSYLLSSLMDNCLERGRNQHGGGAKYHDYGGMHVGLPNVADGLNAIKQAVFDEHICTAQEMLDAIKADYKGYERLRLKLANIPKYGCEDEKADAMAARVFYDFANIYHSYTTRWGGKGRSIGLNFTITTRAAALLGATPDGGHSNRNIAISLTPQSCAQTKGITAAMNSSGKMPFYMFTAGASQMWDMEQSWATPEVGKSLLESFVDCGTHIFQGNVTSVAELLDAKKHPEKYPNLCVRVGGYSAHFIYLSEVLQDSIIERILHKG